MKNLSIIAIIFLSLNSFTFVGKVTEAFCTEMDPFIFGDICIVEVERSESKSLSIIVDFDEFLFELDPEQLVGKEVKVNKNKTYSINDPEELRILQRFNDLTLYVTGSVDSFEVMQKSPRALMRRYANSGRYSREPINLGYSSKKIEVSKLHINKNLKRFLSKRRAGALKQWEDLVMLSGEFDSISIAEKRKLVKNPWGFMKVKYLLEINEVRKVYFKGRHIGWFLEIFDHVQGAVYQDGAWIDTYLDTNLNVIKAVDESS